MNLQDHPATVLSYNCAPGNIGVSTSSKFRLVKGLGIPNPKALFDWAFKGMFTYLCIKSILYLFSQEKDHLRPLVVIMAHMLNQEKILLHQTYNCVL